MGTPPQIYGTSLPPDTSERVPPNPSDTGCYSTYLPRRDGRLSWPSWLDSARPGIELATFRSPVRRRTTAPSRQPNTFYMAEKVLGVSLVRGLGSVEFGNFFVIVTLCKFVGWENGPNMSICGWAVQVCDVVNVVRSLAYPVFVRIRSSNTEHVHLVLYNTRSIIIFRWRTRHQLRLRICLISIR